MSAEGTAEELYQAIQAERAKLEASATGRKKKSEPLPPITADEIPFLIPPTWKWVRLGDVFEITSSRRVVESQWTNSGVPFLRARELVQAAKTGQLSSAELGSNLSQAVTSFYIWQTLRFYRTAETGQPSLASRRVSARLGTPTDSKSLLARFLWCCLRQR
jgi:hypothetical protein